MTAHTVTDDFDIGKVIFDKLKDLPMERQQRVLRWVAEGLGVSVGALPTLQKDGVVQGRQVFLAPVPPSGSGTGMDIKTFIAAKTPRSDNQFAAAVAYFYRFEAPPTERRDSIDAAALQQAARLAGRKRLGHPQVTLNHAKAAGYLDSSNRGEFTINSVGENLIAMTLPGGGETPARQVRKTKIKKIATKGRARAKKR
ncbi:MAG: hypothetical protein ACYCXG_03215 [Acidiferrobacter sp.]